MMFDLCTVDANVRPRRQQKFVQLFRLRKVIADVSITIATAFPDFFKIQISRSRTLSR